MLQEVPDSQVKINGFLLKVSLDLADESRLCTVYGFSKWFLERENPCILEYFM
jgi:hypothetical protein